MNEGSKMEKTTVGGGCFWCLEPIFRDLVGVDDVVVGYAGGEVEDPSYQQVCTGSTGHAEVVQITYDPAEISLEQLLEVFFTVHDPTTLNRQGPDVGTQYRSIILYHDQEQKEAAERVMNEVKAKGLWDNELVTEVEPLDTFYPAEKYHQRYYEKNPNAGYCQAIIAPKVKKFRQKWQDQLKQPSA